MLAHETSLSCQLMFWSGTLASFALKKARVPDQNVGKTKLFHTLEFREPHLFSSKSRGKAPTSWQVIHVQLVHCKN